MADYATKLIKDLPDQFKGKERIEALLTAVGRQMDELAQFYDDLNEKRSLSTAEGVQLDRIGSILGLSRAEAGALIADDDTALDDETYRYILGYKIMLNTSRSTYYDIVRGIRQFYNVYDIEYYESPDEPAAFTLEISADKSSTVMLRNILPVKAAGVLTYYQFGLEASIEVTDELESYTYDAPECGTLLCGTYWQTATLGSTNSHGINVGDEGSAFAYTPDFAGTIPDTATQGSTQEIEVDAESINDGYAVSVNLTGTDISSGTTPDTATQGSTQEIEVDMESSDMTSVAVTATESGTVYCGQ